MAESTRLVDLIQLRIDGFLGDRRAELTAIAPELGEVMSLASSYLSGGKRSRGMFCYWGWQSVAGSLDVSDPLDDAVPASDLSAIVTAAAVLSFAPLSAASRPR